MLGLSFGGVTIGSKSFEARKVGRSRLDLGQSTDQSPALAHQDVLLPFRNSIEDAPRGREQAQQKTTARHLRLPQSQLHQLLQLEGQPDQAPQVRVRPSAALQVPPLRVLLQGQGRRGQAHPEDAQGLRGLRRGPLQALGLELLVSHGEKRSRPAHVAESKSRGVDESKSPRYSWRAAARGSRYIGLCGEFEKMHPFVMFKTTLERILLLFGIVDFYRRDSLLEEDEAEVGVGRREKLGHYILEDVRVCYG
ncbi:hypothetical protein KM043_007649 [Ampulex compressa]|nr:hypothetical protein KM043_007649 [Ampulex compressa]